MQAADGRGRRVGCDWILGPPKWGCRCPTVSAPAWVEALVSECRRQSASSRCMRPNVSPTLLLLVDGWTGLGRGRSSNLQEMAPCSGPGIPGASAVPPRNLTSLWAWDMPGASPAATRTTSLPLFGVPPRSPTSGQFLRYGEYPPSGFRARSKSSSPCSPHSYGIFTVMAWGFFEW